MKNYQITVARNGEFLFRTEWFAVEYQAVDALRYLRANLLEAEGFTITLLAKETKSAYVSVEEFLK